jgi:hypothetical protein
MRVKAYFATVAMLASLIANTAVAAPLVIGILEERLNGDWGSPLQNVVRVGFVKAGSEWVALRCKNPEDTSNAACREVARPEAPITWTIYYRGKVLGTVKSKSWLIPTSVNKESLAITPGRVPTVGVPSKDFSGWMDADVQVGGTRIYPILSLWQKHGLHSAR